MTFKEIQKEIPLLSIIEKAQLLQMITSSITNSFPGIEKNPNVVGGSACIIKTRIPVWTLEVLRRQNCKESQILFDFPSLQAIDLVNAWLYASANKEEIERDIKENE